MNKLDALNYIMRTCEDLKTRSACCRRQVAAAYVTREFVYFGVNGNLAKPCLTKEDCTRQKSDLFGIEQFQSCGSECAEGIAMAASLEDMFREETTLEGSILVTTDFPCERCSLTAALRMSTQGLNTLVFNRYGNGGARGIKQRVCGLYLGGVGIKGYQSDGMKIREVTLRVEADLKDKDVDAVHVPDHLLGLYDCTLTRRVATEIEHVKDLRTAKMPCKIRTSVLLAKDKH
jgi:hypothetical protein